MISKKTLLKEFTAEIEKLKSELITTRQRNGVYLSNESYEEITVESESRRILSEEQQARIETMEANLRNKVQELFSLTNDFATLKKDNEFLKQSLDDTHDILEKTELVLADTRQNLADETTLRIAHQATEEQLSTAGIQLISTLDKTVEDIDGLHSKIRRKSDLQSHNRENWMSSHRQVSDITQLVESRVGNLQQSQQQLLDQLSCRVRGFVQAEMQESRTRQESLQQFLVDFGKGEQNVSGQTSTARDEMNEVLEEIKVLREDVKDRVGKGLQGLSVAAGRISAEVISELESFHIQVCTARQRLGA